MGSFRRGAAWSPGRPGVVFETILHCSVFKGVTNANFWIGFFNRNGSKILLTLFIFVFIPDTRKNSTKVPPAKPCQKYTHMLMICGPSQTG